MGFFKVFFITSKEVGSKDFTFFSAKNFLLQRKYWRENPPKSGKKHEKNAKKGSKTVKKPSKIAEKRPKNA